MYRYKHYVRILSDYPKLTINLNACSGGFYRFGTTTSHGYAIGDKVKFAGYTTDPTINGIHTVTAIISSTRFDIDLACSSPPAEFGTVQQYNLDSFTEVFPLGFKTFSWEKEGDQIFFRKKLIDELAFINRPIVSDTSFNYFKAIEDGGDRCEEISYRIDRSCDNGTTYEEYWNGYLAVNDGKFDLDGCIFSTKIKVDDIYRCLVENGDKEVNVLNATPAVTVPVNYIPVFEYMDCGIVIRTSLAEDTFNGCIFPSLQGDGTAPVGEPIALIKNFSCINTLEGWVVYTQTTESNGGGTLSFDCGTIWVRETSTTQDVGGNPNPPFGAGWINIGSTTLGGQPATQWARPPYNGAYNTYIWTANPSSGPCVFTGQLQLPTETTIEYDTTGRKLADIVDYVSSQNCTVFSEMKSDFFEVNPPGDTPGYVAGTNYVTGATNRIDQLVMIQKSDFLNPTATQKATKGILTFNDVMKIYREVFNAYWFIEDGQIRIEHISWFLRTVAFDLTTGSYLQFIKGTKKYGYVKERMPKEENFKWSEAGNIDFIGAPITYDSACVDRDTISNITIQNVVTDAEWIYNHSSGSSQEGFVLLATEFNSPNYEVLNEVGLISGVSLPNNHLSLANLLYNYHRHERVLLEGNMNNAPETFLSARKTKKQVPVLFPFCCDDELNPETDLIETQLGEGVIEEAKLTVTDNMMQVVLLYD